LGRTRGRGEDTLVENNENTPCSIQCEQGGQKRLSVLNNKEINKTLMREKEMPLTFGESTKAG
jgi:hypothetical protein